MPPAKAASLAGQLAVASAANGLYREASAHTRRAERLLDGSGAADGPIGAYHEAALSHQTAEMLAAAGDRRAAVGMMTSSIRQRPHAERRSRVITLARLAQLQLDIGHLEAACASINALCDDYPHVHSARATDALDMLRRRLLPFSRNPQARAALLRISTLRQGAS